MEEAWERLRRADGKQEDETHKPFKSPGLYYCAVGVVK